MLALAKALLLIARYFHRISKSLEHLEALYKLDLQSRGIYETDPTITDDIEVTYGAKITNPDDQPLNWPE